MSTIIQYIQNRFTYLHLLLLITLVIQGCTKEDPIQPSGLDQESYPIIDNPNDPIDHEIYKFYRTTGIASFYTDTVAKINISKEGEATERFKYVTVSLGYHPVGGTFIETTPLTSRSTIVPVLKLLESEVLPQIRSAVKIKNILFIDSFELGFKFNRIEISHGMTAIQGVKALGIVVKDAAAMVDADKKMYAASILAGISEFILRKVDEETLQTKFFSVSRQLGNLAFLGEIYTGFQMYALLGIPPPPPESLGFLYHPYSDAFFFNTISQPTERSDLRSFLTALFRYPPQELDDLYGDHPPLMEKLSILKEVLIKNGFLLPQ